MPEHLPGGLVRNVRVRKVVENVKLLEVHLFLWELGAFMGVIMVGIGHLKRLKVLRLAALELLLRFLDAF